MKILFLTPQLPFPPRQGTQLRNFHLIRAAAVAHEVDLISFVRPGESLGEASPLREICGQVRLLPVPHRTRWDRLQVLLSSSAPDMAGRLPSRGFAETLRAMLATNSYDAIQVEGIEMASYMAIARSVAPRAAIILDQHNAEYLLQARAAVVDAQKPVTWPRALYSTIQWLKLKRYEAAMCRTADAVLAVSKSDAAALHRLGGIRCLQIVPNGVDTDYYLPSTPSDRDEATLLFTGTMDFRPNVDAVRWFATRILPSVASRKPRLKLLIVGRSPAPAVLTLAARHRNVTVTGSVEDVRPYFAQSTLFVVPIRMGGGVRLKILEALSMAMPVVSTRIGAEGIDLAEGKEILLADGADAFASAVVSLLDDPFLRSRLGRAGRRAAEERFDWREVAPRLLELYQEVQHDRRSL